MGWFVGKIRFYGVSGVDKKAMPTANCKVYYDKKVTKAKKLHGLVACELSSATYGATVWWVLLEEVV